MYTRTDHIDWTRVGLDKHFSCLNESELIQKTLSIIENNDLRYELFVAMQKHCDLKKIFFDHQSEQGPSIQNHLALIIEDYHHRLKTNMIEHVA